MQIVVSPPLGIAAVWLFCGKEAKKASLQGQGASVTALAAAAVTQLAHCTVLTFCIVTW